MMSSVTAKEVQVAVQVTGSDRTADGEYREFALRARDTAERKFGSWDIKGARKFAMKAQGLFPSLDGITQLVSTMDVYYAAESKIEGESDWYGVLSLNAFADEEAVKKQYRKFALQLHPDKNKSVGAEGAFKLISEAWSVLSDRSSKMVYDQKRRDFAASSVDNYVHAFDGRSLRKRGRKRFGSVDAQSAGAHTSGLDTFWTSCNRCRMQYEYLRVYLNHNLLCPNCHHAFMAVETGYPCNGTNSSFSLSTKHNHQHNANHTSAKNTCSVSSNPATTFSATEHVDLRYGSSYDIQSMQWGQYPKSAGASNTSAHCSTQAYEKCKRKQKANYNTDYSITGNAYGQEPCVPKRGRPPKRRDGNYSFSVDIGGDSKEFSEKASTPEAVQIGVAPREGCRLLKRRKIMLDVSQIDLRGLLVEKAKLAVAEKINELTLSISMKLNAKSKLEENLKDKSYNIASANLMKLPKPCNSKGNGSQATVAQGSPDDPNGEAMQPVSSIDVPDPDFHDFDRDRTEKAFQADQVWATYDSEDGMPRLYALIQKIFSLRPFKVRMSFLNSKSNAEFGPVNWVGSGFSKTCGDFRVGKYQITETINMFSHQVSFNKGPRGIINIYPRKHEVWALYRNWSPEWNELTSDDVIYKYEIVEVSDDYNEEQGVAVLPLIKVPSFKAIFRRHTDPKELRRIPREEMFRFSHQIPYKLLTGEEGPNAPKGGHELDPAAMPVDFLHVITELQEGLT